MTRDEREEEREFLERLKMHTGRDLAEWMAAIAAQGFTDKNQTIDWLRTQGLSFPRASRLERIHANGGRPIHANAPARAALAPAPVPAAGPPSQARALSIPAAQARSPGTPPDAVPLHPPATVAALEKLIAGAKGYRPLYQLLEAEIRRVVPAVALTPRPTYISIGAPAEFAAITLHATEVRLGLDLGDAPFGPHLHKARLKGAGPAITHMVVLTDARQVNDDLLNLVRAAASRVHKQL
jgi:hypothetical protein